MHQSVERYGLHNARSFVRQQYHCLLRPDGNNRGGVVSKVSGHVLFNWRSEYTVPSGACDLTIFSVHIDAGLYRCTDCVLPVRY